MKVTVELDLPSRLEVRRVACPECDVAPGKRCIGARGQARTANHMSRIKVWQAAQLPPKSSRDPASPAAA